MLDKHALLYLIDSYHSLWFQYILNIKRPTQNILAITFYENDEQCKWKDAVQ